MESFFGGELYSVFGSVDNFNVFIRHSMTWLAVMLVDCRLVASLVFFNACAQMSMRLPDVTGLTVFMSASDSVNDVGVIFVISNVVLEREELSNLVR